MPSGASSIDQISHLSSVSGGSIAAAYYALKKPGREVKVLNPDGTLSEAYRAFFERYRADLSQDFQTSLIWRQLLSFRWVNSSLATRTLADIFAKRLYGAARMQDISAREKAGDSPGLIVNTTLYNNGRRLAVTSLPGETFDYDFFEDLERSLQHRGRVMEPAANIRQRWELLRPMTPSEIHMDPCALPLSAAVAASASFPPLHRADHPEDRRGGNILACRGRRSLRELGSRVTPLPLPQATAGEAGEASPRHCVRQLLPLLGGRATPRAPLPAVLAPDLRLFARALHHGGARHHLRQVGGGS
jgi:hypothetical protein